MITNMNISKEEVDHLNKYGEKVFHQTGLQFLKSHNGLRNEKLHLIIGTASGGKSTLRNTMIFDFFEHNPGKRVFLYLSEESLKDFKMDIAQSNRHDLIRDNLFAYSEQDNIGEVCEGEEGLDQLFENILKSNCDLFIFDNITTSKLYGSKFDQQDWFANIFKTKMVGSQCPMVLFAHTGKTVKETNTNLIDQNDIRGSSTIVNLSEFLYILQNFKIEEDKITTIRIIKHRGMNAENKMFMLNFSTRQRIYNLDHVLKWSAFDEDIFQKQNRLGSTNQKFKKGY